MTDEHEDSGRPSTSADRRAAQRAEARSRRSAARLAAVQALYQHGQARTPVAQLLNEFHLHRLGAELEGEQMKDADQPFFDDIVTGTLERLPELDALIAARLATGWTMERLDRLMLHLLRAGAYELVARPDIPAAVVITEYVDVARAFYPAAESGFVNAMLDGMARTTRTAG